MHDKQKIHSTHNRTDNETTNKCIATKFHYHVHKTVCKPDIITPVHWHVGLFSKIMCVSQEIKARFADGLTLRFESEEPRIQRKLAI